MSEIIIEHLVPNEDTGEAVWTPYLYSIPAETDFIIDPEDLDAEICGVGPLLNKYGDMHSKLQAQVERYKRAVDEVYSKLYLFKRTELTNAGDKAPDAVVRAHVLQMQEYKDIAAQLVETQRHAIRADGWWKSAMKKADLVQALAYKISSEIKRSAY